MTRPSPAPILVIALLFTALAACTEGPSSADEAERLDETVAELVDRFTPGLHTLMVDLAMRHASLWFAGEARNWPLADYMVHELEELVEEIEDLHAVYRDIQVAELLREMTHPAVEALEEAVEEEDPEAFEDAYDALTTACNACHVASDRGAIMMQRPTAPPLTNIRFRP
jgi:hypothetical protein